MEFYKLYRVTITGRFKIRIRQYLSFYSTNSTNRKIRQKLAPNLIHFGGEQAEKGIISFEQNLLSHRSLFLQIKSIKINCFLRQINKLLASLLAQIWTTKFIEENGWKTIIMGCKFIIIPLQSTPVPLVNLIYLIVFWVHIGHSTQLSQYRVLLHHIF